MLDQFRLQDPPRLIKSKLSQDSLPFRFELDKYGFPASLQRTVHNLHILEDDGLTKKCYVKASILQKACSILLLELPHQVVSFIVSVQLLYFMLIYC